MTELINRILVPVDFSSHSERALRYATRLAGQSGASIELLHVVDIPIASGAWTSEVYVPDLPQMLDTLLNEANKRLAALKSAAATEGIDVETRVLTGRPADTIIEHARASACDLIVMGTHGRTGFSHLFVGSVAERVVRRAPCPVLTVRELTRTTEETASGPEKRIA